MLRAIVTASTVVVASWAQAQPVPAPVADPGVPPSAPAPAPVPPEAAKPPAISFTPYGFVLLNAYWNVGTANAVDVPAFATPGPVGSFGMTARQSRLGLKVDLPGGGALAGASARAQVEVDFFGGFPNGNTGEVFPLPRLRLAFAAVTWKSMGKLTVTAGQDWGLVAPVNPVSLAHVAVPEFAASGNPWYRAPTLRLSGELGGDVAFNWALGMVFPTDGDPASATAYTFANAAGAGELARVPAGEARLAAIYRQGDKPVVEVGISGRLGRERVWAGDGTRVDLDHWVAAADVQVNVAFVQLRGEAYTGQNLEFAQAGIAQGARIGATSANSIRTQGAWAQLTLFPKAPVTMHLGAGIDLPTVEDLPAGAKWQNGTLAATVVVKPHKHVRAALGYNRIVTRSGAGDSEANVLNLAVQAEF